MIDGIIEHSPADDVRRLNVSPESPTLGISHLQCKALLSAARAWAKRNGFAPVAMPAPAWVADLRGQQRLHR
ncbi:hypothetical protein [Actinomadura sp. 9N215]|uniref:hypothetical protein n=1 Tax=Actinomadura sp. 9N215 TaxID=3375150 RepID=UPI00379985B3